MVETTFHWKKKSVPPKGFVVGKVGTKWYATFTVFDTFKPIADWEWSWEYEMKHDNKLYRVIAFDDGDYVLFVFYFMLEYP